MTRVLECFNSLWMLWAGSVFFAVFAMCVMTPPTCSEISTCSTVHARISSRSNEKVLCLVTLALVFELMSLLSTFQGIREVRYLVPGVRSRFFPSLLLALSYVVLIIQHAIFTFSSSAWYVHAKMGQSSHGRPVYTVTHSEWIIVVPMLLIMCGHCALGRPMEEVTPVALITNFYIVLSWVAGVTSSSLLRDTLIFTTMAMYGWASYLMIVWIQAYLREASPDLPNRQLRPILSIGIILAFLVYAVVYLAGLYGFMSALTERSWYMFLDSGTKLTMSAIFVMIRTREYHRALNGLVGKMGCSNVALVSILRGSFDFIVPCNASFEGDCTITTAKTADLQHLESVLGCSLAGKAFASLLAEDTQRVFFASYVQNTIQQANNQQVLSSATLSPDGTWCGDEKSVLPPVAQVLNCRLKGGRKKCVMCAIHLSAKPPLTLSVSSDRWQLMAAIRLHEYSAEVSDQAKSIQEAQANANAFTPVETLKGCFVASLKDLAYLGVSNLLMSGTGSTTSGDGSRIGGETTLSCNDSVVSESVAGHSRRSEEVDAFANEPQGMKHSDSGLALDFDMFDRSTTIGSDGNGRQISNESDRSYFGSGPVNECCQSQNLRMPMKASQDERNIQAIAEGQMREYQTEWETDLLQLQEPFSSEEEPVPCQGQEHVGTTRKGQVKHYPMIPASHGARNLLKWSESAQLNLITLTTFTRAATLCSLAEKL